MEGKPGPSGPGVFTSDSRSRRRQSMMGESIPRALSRIRQHNDSNNRSPVIGDRKRCNMAVSQ